MYLEAELHTRSRLQTETCSGGGREYTRQALPHPGVEQYRATWQLTGDKLALAGSEEQASVS